MNSPIELLDRTQLDCSTAQQVWRDAAQWKGWLLAAEQAGPPAYPALLSLPPSVLARALAMLRQGAALRPKVHSPQSHRSCSCWTPRCASLSGGCCCVHVSSPPSALARALSMLRQRAALRPKVDSPITTVVCLCALHVSCAIPDMVQTPWCCEKPRLNAAACVKRLPEVLEANGKAVATPLDCIFRAWPVRKLIPDQTPNFTNISPWKHCFLQ